LLEGRRLRRCAPLARLYWPVLYSLSNAYCRIELDYELMSDKLTSFRDLAPDADRLAQMFEDYRANHLLYIYKYKLELELRRETGEETGRDSHRIRTGHLRSTKAIQKIKPKGAGSVVIH